MVQAEGARLKAPLSAFSAWRRRAAHSLTTRRQPRNPCRLRRLHSSVALRCPVAHCSSSHCRCNSSELSRTRNTSERCPRSTLRTRPRLCPVRRTISLIVAPSLACPRMMALASSRRRYPSYWIRSAAVSSSGLSRHRWRHGSAAWIRAPRPGTPGWRFPSGATGRRPVSLAAAPWSLPERSCRLDHARRPRSAAGLRANPVPLPVRDPAEARSFYGVRDRDDRPIAFVASPCPIVDANHRRRDKTRAAAPSHHAQQRILAHRQHQPAGETRRGPAAQGKPEMVDDVIEPGGTPRPRRQHIWSKPLNENTASAKDGIAMEPPRHDDEPNWPARHWQIRQAPTIAAVDPFAVRPTFWTSVRCAYRTEGDHHTCAITTGVLHDKSAWYQFRGSESMPLGFDFFYETIASLSQIASKVS